MAFGSGAVIKPGTIQSWGGTTAPDGWLMCDGSAISRSLYAELYAVIGDTYGAGDGSTTFNLPNLIGATSDNVPCKGNGKAIGIATNSSNVGGLRRMSNDAAVSLAPYLDNDLPFTNNGSGFTPAAAYQYMGVTTDATKSGIVSSLSSAAQKSAAIIKY